MNLQEIKANYNRGRMDLSEIEWLIQTLEKRNLELAGALEREASYIDDIEQIDVMVDQLQQEVKLYKTQETLLFAKNKIQAEEIVQLKGLNKYKLFKENLKLEQELAELKAVKS
ncbi:hypothetical protein ACT8ZR_09105 [Neobacillus sp. M.A.Huq-85]